MGRAVSFIKKVIVLVGLFAIAFAVIQFYSVLFAKTVVGRIENVARVTEVTAILGNRPVPESQIYSFSVSIKQPNGELLTATTEDRQWAVAKTGLCVKARFYPYPPWHLEKAGTFFNARLLSLVECTSAAAKELGIDANQYGPPPSAVPAATPAISETPSHS